jgi:diketogulonate reductase-like aldo/keto reductase
MPVADLTRSCGQAPAVNQIDWGPALYDGGMLAGLAGRGIAVEGYSGLKNTRLGDPVLAKIAAGHGVTTAQVVVEHGCRRVSRRPVSGLAVAAWLAC